MRDIDNRICCTTVDTKLSRISCGQEAREVYDLGTATQSYSPVPVTLSNSLAFYSQQQTPVSFEFLRENHRRYIRNIFTPWQA